ncbi:MAG: biotin--[acetyl-CoA-carboxylase] ligase [Acidobacteriota bacterium]|nr:biotin--[acetyl-CoA-carboxylase] ligase [Acidobacteriota bacterium]
MEFPRHVAELERRRPLSSPRALDNLVVLSSVPSTNLLAKGIALDYETEGLALLPLLILAWEQSAGRGRQGRSWSSPAGRGVYATLVVPVADPGLLGGLPLLVGTGLCRALAPHLTAPCRLKWPNDLLVDADPGDASRRRKIGGILIESLIRPGEPPVALVGFGVNHGQEQEELPPGATSLHLQGNDRVTLADLTWDLVGAVERELEHLGDTAYAVASYRELIVHRPGERLVCQAGGEVIEGRFLGIGELGHLRIDCGGRERTLAAGEVIES